jgi:hypothetical protein
MARIPSSAFTKVSGVGKAIFDMREEVEAGREWRRPHLGASQIGRSCWRQIWLNFRWTLKPKHPGRLLRLFERGSEEEPRFVRDMIACGMDVMDTDPETGEQFRVSAIDGHFGGSMDGIVTNGVPGALNKVHVLELKTANQNSFRRTRKEGVQVAKPEHYAQMQTYMGLLIEAGKAVRRALYLMVCKNDDDIHDEVLDFDEPAYKSIMRKAESIVYAEAPPARIDGKPDKWPCNWCDSKTICHSDEGYAEIDRNCRTCASVVPERGGEDSAEGGQWRCTLYDEVLNFEAQCRGCQSHVINPSILDQWTGVAGDNESRTVTYRKSDGTIMVDTNGTLSEED